MPSPTPTHGTKWTHTPCYHAYLLKCQSLLFPSQSIFAHNAASPKEPAGKAQRRLGPDERTLAALPGRTLDSTQHTMRLVVASLSFLLLPFSPFPFLEGDFPVLAFPFMSYFVSTRFDALPIPPYPPSPPPPVDGQALIGSGGLAGDWWSASSGV